MSEKVVFVMLRQPDRSDPEESRSDPFYEFGCFGLTGCHQRNLLSDSSADGARLAFVQGGEDELRLVFVTPPVSVAWRGTRLVANWKPAEMPLRFVDAPVLVDNRAPKRNTALVEFLKNTKRPTPVAKFTSRFRSRKLPLAEELAIEVLEAWNAAARNGRRSATYVEALPYLPSRPLDSRERKRRFQELLRDAGVKSWCGPSRKRNGH